MLVCLFLLLSHFFFQIHDSTLSGSSDDDDFLGALRGPSSFANAFLYVGLGTVALGLVITFVGTGEKGFKTVELRLIGPSLIGMIYQFKHFIFQPRTKVVKVFKKMFFLSIRNRIAMLYSSNILLYMSIDLYFIKTAKIEAERCEGGC